MSSRRNDAKCRICAKLLRNIKGTHKLISSDEDLEKFFPFFEEEINIGDYLCSHCRCATYKKRKSDVLDAEIPSTSTTIPAAIQLPSTSENVGMNFAATISTENESDSFSSLQSLSQSSVDDPSVHFNLAPVVPTEFIEIQMKRTLSSHKYCCICHDTSNLTLVPQNARTQCFVKKNIFIPAGNRCCKKHILHDRFYDEDLQNINAYSNWTTIDSKEITSLMKHLTIESNTTLLNRIDTLNISENQLEVYTGLKWDNIAELAAMLKSLRNSDSRTVTQAIVVFLCRMRTANSNKLIATIFGLEDEQRVSHYSNQVIDAFEKDVLPSCFGLTTACREQLINEHTTDIAKKIIDDADNRLILIFDGTYARHQKSTNNEYQRKSFSGQKKTHLLKPFTICTTNGFIVDMLGPYGANENDAAIIRKIIDNNPQFCALVRAGDICIVDRGFRDVCDYLVGKGFRVLMPAFKGKRAQLSTKEANESRFVTKLRWAVESTHGMLKQKFRILDHKFDNKMLNKVGSYYRIASFLHNKYSKRLTSDVGISDDILESMESQKSDTNTLAVEVDNLGWRRKTVPFEIVSAEDLPDFPVMDETALKILFTGSYQYKQSISYLSEMIDDDGVVNIRRVKDKTNILKLQVQSRHINSKQYRCFIEYTSYLEVTRYCCECANGLRTVGCCSHVAAIIYYLAYGRYLSRIIRPAEILSRLFDNQDEIVIEEDSDED